VTIVGVSATLAQEAKPGQLSPEALENNPTATKLPPLDTPNRAVTGVLPKAIDDTISASIKIPCVCQYDTCTGDVRLNVGDLWAALYSQGARQTQANAYWTSGQCGRANHACCIFGSERNLVISVDNAWLQNFDIYNVGISSAQFSLGVYEYWGTCDNNPQSVERYFSDIETCKLESQNNLPGTYSIHSVADSGAACTGQYGDPDPSGCNLPDVLIAPPTFMGQYAVGTRCYDYYIYVRTCNKGWRSN